MKLYLLTYITLLAPILYLPSYVKITTLCLPMLKSLVSNTALPYLLVLTVKVWYLLPVNILNLILTLATGLRVALFLILTLK